VLKACYAFNVTGEAGYFTELSLDLDFGGSTVALSLARNCRVRG
jgi:hypothetical protein